MSRVIFRVGLSTLCAVGVMAAGSAKADSFTYDYDSEFSGGQAPGSSTTPWLTATFSDVVGGVKLVLAAPHLTGTENVDGWYFNVLAAQVGNLTFSETAHTGSPGYVPPPDQGLASYKADGDGKYDIRLNFNTGTTGFRAGDTLTFLITSTVSGLDADSFKKLSTETADSTHGPFDSAAHVQNTTGTGSGGSGWIEPSLGPQANGSSPPVPDGGSTVALLGLGMLGIGVVRTRFSRK